MPQSATTAFDALIAPHLPRLYRAAWRLAGHRADAEDLIQDTCLAACENLPALRAADHPDRWLLRVLYHRFVDGSRCRRRSPVVAIDALPAASLAAADEAGPEELAAQADGERRFVQAWCALPAVQQVLLTLRAEGYGLAEIESITGIAREVLRARLHRARLSLARHLNPTTDEAVVPSRLGSAT